MRENWYEAGVPGQKRFASCFLYFLYYIALQVSLLITLSLFFRMTILKNIPVCVPPELLYVLAKMGHGDELVIVDANFPAASVAACTPGGIIRCDGLGGAAMLEAVLKVGGGGDWVVL